MDLQGQSEKAPGKPGASGGAPQATDRVDRFFSLLRHKNFWAALIIFGSITLALAQFTTSFEDLYSAGKRLLTPRKERALETLRERRTEATGESLLRSAAEGDVSTVELLLDAGVGLDSRDANGWTALHWAAWNGHHDIVEVLLDGGSDPNPEDQAGQTPLMEASAACRANVVERLLDAGVGVRDSHGEMALYWAAEGGCEEVIQKLLLHQANANAQLTAGWTPLMAASARGHLSAVRALLEGGADPRPTNHSGQTAEDLALAHHHGAVARQLRSTTPQEVQP